MKINSLRSYALILGLAALAIFGLARLYYFLTDDFRLNNIIFDGNESNWPDFPLTDDEKNQLFKIIDQKFYYIGKGAQSYAFVSEDQNYVLKFFKFKHLKPNWMVDLIPSLPLLKNYKKEISKRKKRKLESIFIGYELAYRENKEGSALVYMHLIPTDFIKQKVTVVDKIGFKSQIDLDNIVFLIQRKGDMLRTRMHHYLTNHQIEQAKLAVDKILAMYVEEYKKGLYDRDHGVMRNTGFVGEGIEKPFHLDVGKLSKDDRMQNVDFYREDFKQVVWKINEWIRSNYPQEYLALSKHLADKFYFYTGSHFDIENSAPMKYRKKR